MAESINGATKAAVFLMAMGEEFTTKVFKHLDQSEIMDLGERMANIKKMDSKIVSAVMDEFKGIYGNSGGLGLSGEQFLERTVSKAFDTRKAGDILGDLLQGKGTKSFDSLNHMSPQALANILMGEHPQTIALIMVNMKHQPAAEAIQELPEHLRSEVITRIADLDDVPNDIINEIHAVIEEQVSDISNDSNESFGGIEAAAEILNNMDHKTENTILETIENDREELAEEIRQSMFLFEDLGQLDDRSIRALLKEISNDELVLALKTASEELTEKIFANVSQRAAQMMREDMEVMGPVKLREVEQAQLNIIKIARRLADEGKLVLGGKGGDDVLV